MIALTKKISESYYGEYQLAVDENSANSNIVAINSRFMDKLNDINTVNNNTMYFYRFMVSNPEAPEAKFNRLYREQMTELILEYRSCGGTLFVDNI